MLGRPIGSWSRRTGAPEASATRRDRNPAWSVLGPQPIGEPRTTVDKRGHRTLIETAGRYTYSPLTSGGEDRRRGVRVSPPPPAEAGHRPASLLSRSIVPAADRRHPAASWTQVRLGRPLLRGPRSGARLPKVGMSRRSAQRHGDDHQDDAEPELAARRQPSRNGHAPLAGVTIAPGRTVTAMLQGWLAG